MKKYSNISSWILIFINLPLILTLFTIIVEDGGLFRLGWIVMPYLLFCNTFLIPAIANLFIHNLRVKKVLFVVNCIGLIPAIIVIYDFVTRQI